MADDPNDTPTTNQDFETVLEVWNEYRLADGTIVRLKTILRTVQACHAEDGSIRVSKNGEQMISVRTQLVMATIPPPVVVAPPPLKALTH